MAKIGINLKEGKIEKRKPSVVIGIDLGTTNSLVAIVHNGKSEVLKNDEGDSRLVPSVIHFNEHLEPSIGETAKVSLTKDPRNTIFSVKRLMGKSYKDVAEFGRTTSYKIIDNEKDDLVRVEIQGRHFSPIELSAIILKSLKQRAEKALNSEVFQAVITVPAYFNDSQRQATRDAGKLAGLDVLRIVNEPTAAALAYGIGQDSSDEEIIAVYDLGGGTFDISILQISNGVFEVLSTHGDTALGGDDLDEAIVQYWCQKHSKLDMMDPKLRWLAEKAKKDLTTEQNAEYLLQGISLLLNRETLGSIVQPYIDRTIASCNMALKDAGLTIDEIDKVVLVGGSTRLNSVKTAVQDLFQLEPYDKINPDEIVARGAAIQADILAGNRKDLLLLDITPLSLGIETLGGLMDVIIPRNTSIPIKAAREYTTSVDGQANLKVSVFQGEREMIADNRKLGEFILKGIPSMAAGIPKIEIAFIIDANGILQVTATEKRSNTKQVVEIKSQYGISDREMAQMLKDSLTHASEDMAKRSLREAEIDGQLLLKSMITFKNQHIEIIENNVEEISRLEVVLQEALKTKDKDIILQAIETLNDFTRPFAEKAMDKTISHAMKGKKI